MARELPLRWLMPGQFALGQNKYGMWELFNAVPNPKGHYWFNFELTYYSLEQMVKEAPAYIRETRRGKGWDELAQRLERLVEYERLPLVEQVTTNPEEVA